MKNLRLYIKSHGEKLLVVTDQGLVSGVNFIVAILLTRFLGLEVYGLYVLAWMVVLFISSMQQAFIIMPLYTLYPKQDLKEQYLSGLMGIQLIFSVTSVLAVCILVSFAMKINPEWSNPGLVFLTGLVTGLHSFNDYLRRLFFVLHKPGTVLIMDLIGYGVLPVIILVLVALDQLSIHTVLISICCLLMLSISFSLIFRYDAGFGLKKNSLPLGLHWRFSKFLIGTSLLQWFSGNLFIVVAGSTLGPVSVGAIRIAQNIIGVLHVLFIAMENLIPVRASELYKTNGRKSMLKYIGIVSKQAAVPTSILLGIIAIFRNEIIRLFYGEVYLEFHYLLLLFAGLYILVFIGTILRFIIRTIEKNRLIFTSYIASGILSMALAKPLVSSFGLLGVMIGLFLVQILSLTIYFFSLKSDLKWIFK